MQSLQACTHIFQLLLPSTIRAWNELSDEIKGASTVSAFKYQLNKHKKLIPMFFHAGTRKGHTLHTRIHRESSSVNSHFIVRTLSTVCPVLVVALKMLIIFICLIYRQIRNTYLSDVLQTHNTHELLYGKEAAIDLENEALFMKVQDFIIHSNRFD